VDAGHRCQPENSAQTILCGFPTMCFPLVVPFFPFICSLGVRNPGILKNPIFSPKKGHVRFWVKRRHKTAQSGKNMTFFVCRSLHLTPVTLYCNRDRRMTFFVERRYHEKIRPLRAACGDVIREAEKVVSTCPVLLYRQENPVRSSPSQGFGSY